MKPVKAWLAFGRWFRKPARAKREKATRKPCAACGRIVAHTKGGAPYLHGCQAAQR